MRMRCGSALTLLMLLVPAGAWAQASLTGTVRDSSGAVLPGVTVEAGSDALIEKARTAITDGSGQYRIVDLPAGSYKATFTISGFATVVRDAIALSGAFTATVNVEMRVGGIEETVTITGASPIVDVQSTVRQDVLKGSLITELPAARNIQNIAILIPGMAVAGTLDVGGLRGGAEVNNFSAHGGRVDDGRLQLDGMSVGGPTGGATANSGGGGTSYFQPDMGNASELAVTTSGALGEAESGGPVINVVPKSGGNKLSGAFFFSFANSALQGDNLTDELRALGTRPATEDLITMRDLTGSIGGPINRDKVWYFVSARTKRTEKKVPIMLYNKNAGTNAWLYEADPARQAFNDSTTHAGNVRLTWQASQRHKLNFYYDEQSLKDNHEGGGTATTSPEGRRNGRRVSPASDPDRLAVAVDQPSAARRHVFNEHLRLRRARARRQRDARPGARQRHRDPERDPVADLPLDELEREPRVRATVEDVRRLRHRGPQLQSGLHGLRPGPGQPQLHQHQRHLVHVPQRDTAVGHDGG
jgi:hypothetical protein